MRELLGPRHPAGVRLAQPVGDRPAVHPRHPHRPRRRAVRRRGRLRRWPSSGQARRAADRGRRGGVRQADRDHRRAAAAGRRRAVAALHDRQADDDSRRLPRPRADPPAARGHRYPRRRRRLLRRHQHAHGRLRARHARRPRLRRSRDREAVAAAGLLHHLGRHSRPAGTARRSICRNGRFRSRSRPTGATSDSCISNINGRTRTARRLDRPAGTTPGPRRGRPARWPPSPCRRSLDDRRQR